MESAQVPSSPPPDYEENFMSAEAREEILRIISKHLNKIARRLKWNGWLRLELEQTLARALVKS